jgi:hypothetical protein
MTAEIETPAGPRPLHPRLTVVALAPADRVPVAEKYAPPEIVALDERIRMARSSAQIARARLNELDAELARLRAQVSAITVEELNQAETAVNAARVAEEAARRELEHVASGAEDRTESAYRDLLTRRETISATLARPEPPDTGPVRVALDAAYLALTNQRRSDPMALAILDRWRHARSARQAYVVAHAATWGDPTELAQAEERKQRAADDLADAQKARVRRQQRVARAEEQLAAAEVAFAELRGGKDSETGSQLEALTAEVAACRAAATELLGHDPGDGFEHALATHMVPPETELAALRRALNAAGIGDLTPRWNSAPEFEAIATWCDDADRERTVRLALTSELADVNGRLARATVAHTASAGDSFDATARRVGAEQALAEARRQRDAAEFHLADLRAQATAGDPEVRARALEQLADSEVAWPAAAALAVKADKAVVALLSERHALIDHLLRQEPWAVGCLVLDEPGDGVAPADLPGLLMTIDARAERGAVVILTTDPDVIAWAGAQPADHLGVAA